MDNIDLNFICFVCGIAYVVGIMLICGIANEVNKNDVGTYMCNQKGLEYVKFEYSYSQTFSFKVYCKNATIPIDDGYLVLTN